MKDKTDKFIDACIEGNLEIVKFWIENNADIHSYDDLGFREACERGHTDVVKLLIEKGADIHIYNDLGFWWACEKDHTDIIKLLKKHMKKKENKMKNKTEITEKAEKKTEWLITVTGCDCFYTPAISTVTVKKTLKEGRTPIDWFLGKPTVYCRFDFIPNALINFWKIK